ncbi:MAG: WXG100 family type VII secretion target [Eubacteriales bacterium]|nr:WXG100 family type VII secretion target [Eubacteriales bacterium]
MNIILKVTPEKLKSQAETMEQWCEKLQEEIGNIESDLSNVSGFWEGEAAVRAQELRRDWVEKSKVVAARLKTSPPRLLQMAGIYETAEKTAESVTQTLKSDVL